MNTRRQGGFSLLQIMVALALSLALSTSLFAALQAFQSQGRFDQVLEEARRVAAICDELQNRVTASAIGPDGVYTYTYAGASATWRDVQDLADETGVDVPTTTDYGTPYQYRADGFPAQVRFDVPAAQATDVTPPGDVAVTNLAGGAIRVTFQRLRPPELKRSTRLRATKSQYFLEELR